MNTLQPIQLKSMPRGKGVDVKAFRNSDDLGFTEKGFTVSTMDISHIYTWLHYYIYIHTHHVYIYIYTHTSHVYNKYVHLHLSIYLSACLSTYLTICPHVSCITRGFHLWLELFLGFELTPGGATNQSCPVSRMLPRPVWIPGFFWWRHHQRSCVDNAGWSVYVLFLHVQPGSPEHFQLRRERRFWGKGSDFHPSKLDHFLKKLDKPW